MPFKTEQFKNLSTKLLGDVTGKKPLVAIEMGTSSLKVVVADRNNDALEVEDFLVEDLALIGEEGRLGFAKERLAQFLKEKNISGGHVFLVVEDETIFSTRMTLPRLSQKELKNAISWEVKDSLPFPEQEAISDYHLIGESQKADGSKNLELIFIAIHRKAIDESIALLEPFNFTLENVNIVPGSLLNFLNRAAGFDTKEPIAVLELGYNHIGLSIFKDKKLIFTRRLSMGSSDITNSMLGAVSTEQGVVRLSYNDAEKIKQEYGILTEGQRIEIRNTSIDSLRLSSMMRPVMERMVAEIRNSFTYLTDKLGEPYVSKVYLTGRGSRLKNMDSFFSQQLGIPVDFLSFEGVASFSPNITPEKKSELPYLAVAISALLLNKKGLDFLPPEFRSKKRVAVEWMVLRLATITLASILLVSNLYLSVALMYYNKRNKLIRLNESTLQALTEVNNEIRSLQEMVSSVKRGGIIGSALLAEISKITPPSVSVERIEFSGSGGLLLLQLKGHIYGTERDASPTLTRYIKTLEDSVFFENAILMSSSQAGSEDQPQLNFSINSKLESYSFNK